MRMCGSTGPSYLTTLRLNRAASQRDPRLTTRMITVRTSAGRVAALLHFRKRRAELEEDGQRQRCDRPEQRRRQPVGVAGGEQHRGRVADAAAERQQHRGHDARQRLAHDHAERDLGARRAERQRRLRQLVRNQLDHLVHRAHHDRQLEQGEHDDAGQQRGAHPDEQHEREAERAVDDRRHAPHHVEAQPDHVGKAARCAAYDVEVQGDAAARGRRRGSSRRSPAASEPRMAFRMPPSLPM